MIFVPWLNSCDISLINEMSRDKAIIVSTHILEEVEAVCTDTVIISDGKLVKSGTPEELLKSDPDHNSIVVLTKKKDGLPQLQFLFFYLKRLHHLKQL